MGGRKRKRQREGDLEGERGGQKEEGKVNLALICQDTLWLILNFCLGFIDDLNIFRTQDTEHCKFCELGLS